MFVATHNETGMSFRLGAYDVLTLCAGRFSRVGDTLTDGSWTIRRWL
jgi:hypothetical protein